MTACGGGARMTAAAAAATMRMAAPWVIACSFLLSLATFQGAEGAIGVNYGMIANNLPEPEQVISMYKAKNINYVRLFHPDTSVLNALRGSGIGVVLGTLNEDLPRLASVPSYAASWVATNVQPFAGAVQFRYINAGNEVIPGDTAAQVLPAMQNLESALRSAGTGGATGWSLWATDHPALGPTEAHPCSSGTNHNRIPVERINESQANTGLQLARDRRATVHVITYSTPYGAGAAIEIGSSTAAQGAANPRGRRTSSSSPRRVDGKRCAVIP